MKKIFASFCLLAFAFLAFNVTPAYSREVIRKSVSYNTVPGVSYTTTKVTTKPTRMTTGEKIGTAIAATALIGGIVALAAVSAHDDVPPRHEYHYTSYHYDNHRGHSDFHRPPKPMNSHYSQPHKAPIPAHRH